MAEPPIKRALSPATGSGGRLPSRDLTEAFAAQRRCYARLRSRASLDTASEEMKKRQAVKQRSLSNASWLLLKPISLFVGASMAQTAPHCAACNSTELRACTLCACQFCVKCDGEGVRCKRCSSAGLGTSASLRWTARVRDVVSGNPLVPLYSRAKELKARVVEENTKYEYLAQSLVDPAFASHKKEAARAVIDAVKEQQKVVEAALSELEDVTRALAEAAMKSAPAEQQVAANMRASIVNLTAEVAPSFRKLYEKTHKEEVQTVTNVYMVVYRLRIEAKDNSRFEKLFGSKLTALLQTVRKDLSKVVLESGRNWEEYKKEVDDFIAKWDSVNKPLMSATVNPLLASASAAPAGSEALMLRKCISVLTRCLKDLDAGVASDKLGDTKQAIAILADDIQAQYMA